MDSRLGRGFRSEGGVYDYGRTDLYSYGKCVLDGVMSAVLWQRSGAFGKEVNVVRGTRTGVTQTGTGADAGKDLKDGETT